jgi:uncharacterized protein YbjT (DUF2867 family)
MADRKVIAVAGATGAQGGGLVRAILDDPEGGFAARALTRDPDSPAARALAEAGAEVVRADLDDPASVEAAFEGAHGAYCVTFFWGHLSPELEMTHAETLAEAARRAGVEHVVWSTLEDTRLRVPLDDDRMPTLMERYKTPHLDAKGASDRFFTDRGLPVTFLLTSFYWDNLIHFGMAPQRGEDGRLAFVLPMGDRKLPGIAAEDIGRCAYGVFRRGGELVGERVGIAGGHLSGAEMAASLGRVLGEEVVHVSPPFDVYRGFGFPGADDLGNMFQYKHDFNDEYRAARSVEVSRQLEPRLLGFDEWLDANAGRLPRG